jgi:chemotaxis signal transduction protein
VSTSASLEHKLAVLRREFEQSFARSAGGTQQATLDFLTIRVAGDSYALRLSEVRSLHAERKLVAVPSPLPELLGLSGFRSVLTPVYDLAQLLGYGFQPPLRSLIVAENASPVAFAFGGFDAHLRVPPEAVSAPESLPGTAAGVHGAVLSAGRALPLLDLPALIAGIARRIKALGPLQEG